MKTQKITAEEFHRHVYAEKFGAAHGVFAGMNKHDGEIWMWGLVGQIRYACGPTYYFKVIA
jgi:hypothetical protein